MAGLTSVEGTAESGWALGEFVLNQVSPESSSAALGTGFEQLWLGPAVVFRYIFQGWMQQVSLAQEHNYPIIWNGPLWLRVGYKQNFWDSEALVQLLRLLGLGMSQCWKNGIDFKPGACWVCSCVLIPASQEPLACTNSAAEALPLSPKRNNSDLCLSFQLKAWLVFLSLAAGSASRAELVTCKLLCSEAAKKLVFSVLIKMQRN